MRKMIKENLLFWIILFSTPMWSVEERGRKLIILGA